jgi:hypothetical protein
MRQLNNKHFDTIEGASALPGEIVSSQFAPSVSQKDENQMVYLKGTDWIRHYCAPSGGAYYKIIDGVRVDIQRRETYTSRNHRYYKRCYRVVARKDNGYLGQRNTFKKAMELAEGGK